MIRVCGDCRRFLGLKRPWLNWSITHGLCSVCFRKLLRQLEPKLRALDNDPDKMLQDAP